ncbi:MAG: PIN domain-containing protein [Bacteroidota bacterium]
MNVLFDTDALIEYLRGNPEVAEYVFSIGGEERIIISSVTYGEILLFAKDRPHLNRLRKTLSLLILLDVNEGISELFRQHMELYSLSHRPSIPDMLNSAFAKYYDISFFTLNIADYSFVKSLTLVPHAIKPMPRKKGFW